MKIKTIVMTILFFNSIFLVQYFAQGVVEKAESSRPNYQISLTLGLAELASISYGRYVSENISLTAKLSLAPPVTNGTPIPGALGFGFGANYLFKSNFIMNYISVDLLYIGNSGTSGFGFEYTLGHYYKLEKGLGVMIEIGGLSAVNFKEKINYFVPIIKIGLNLNF